MKIFDLGTTGATGQPIIRDAAASGQSIAALVRAKARSGLPEAEKRFHGSSATRSTEKAGIMSGISWRQASALALAAFFVAGSLSNIFASASIYGEYIQWGYPRWFHFVTGSLELTTAVLLARGRTRLWGSALGCTVMLAALATVTLHGEYWHAVAPLVAATLSIAVGWFAWRASRLPTESPVAGKPSQSPQKP